MAADRAVKLPANISYEQAAAMMLKGMTAEYLVRRTFKVEKGMNVLMHAAAGGVGLILCQWANHLGANVIGTVGSKDKAALAKANGCHHTILYRDEDFVARVKEITGGKLCDVVYDGIGKTTFPASLDCIRPLGMFVSFGSASGQIDAFNINILQQKGSLFATRPTLNTYAAKREDLLAIANDLFDVVGSGAVKIPVNQKYPLREAAKAHRDLEGRATTGSSILHPVRRCADVSRMNEIWGYWATLGWAFSPSSAGNSIGFAIAVVAARGQLECDPGNAVRRHARHAVHPDLQSGHDCACWRSRCGSRAPIRPTTWRCNGRRQRYVDGWDRRGWSA